MDISDGCRCWGLDGVFGFCLFNVTNPALLTEIRGNQGSDLTLHCSAPDYLNNPTLEWSFSNGVDVSHILTHNSQTGDTVYTPPWDKHVELDGFRVPFGDGSLRLMDPEHSKHTGSYTCTFSKQRNMYTERTDVTIDSPVGEVTHTT